MIDALYQAIYDHQIVKTGEFTLKSGAKSKIYIDFRHVLSVPEINRIIIEELGKKVELLRGKFDFICGVPIGALHYASVVAWTNNIPALTYRKDVKAHGTKKVIEGNFKSGQKVLLIEDVVTTGGSIIQAAEAISREGLVVSDVCIIFDRNQGAKENLEVNKINAHSLLNMADLLTFLEKSGHMSKSDVEHVKNNMPKLKAEEAILPKPICSRLTEHLNMHPMSRYLLNVIVEKKSNVCVALDFKTHDMIYQAAKALVPHVCMIKVHADIITEYQLDEMKKLRALCDANQCLLMEDRKLADTGTTVRDQIDGTFHMPVWAHLITVHALPGPALFEGALQINEIKEAQCGLIVVAELSTENALTTEEYKNLSVKLSSDYSNVVAGFVCQKRCHTADTLVYLTPGVNIGTDGDAMGQQFRTPLKAIEQQHNDVVIVGRGITSGATLAEMTDRCLKFKQQAWEALTARKGI